MADVNFVNTYRKGKTFTSAATGNETYTIRDLITCQTAGMIYIPTYAHGPRIMKEREGTPTKNWRSHRKHLERR